MKTLALTTFLILAFAAPVGVLANSAIDPAPAAAGVQQEQAMSDITRDATLASVSQVTGSTAGTLRFVVLHKGLDVPATLDITDDSDAMEFGHAIAQLHAGRNVVMELSLPARRHDATLQAPLLSGSTSFNVGACLPGEVLEVVMNTTFTGTKFGISTGTKTCV